MRELRSARLALRPVAETDAGAYAALRGDPRTRVHSRSGSPVPAAAARQELLDACASWRQHRYGHWLIAAVDGTVLGVIVVQPARDPSVPELGWIVAPEAWGQGIATEAAKLVTADLFEHTDVTGVQSYLQASNAASRRVAEKLGMRLRERGTDSSGKELEVYELRRPA